MGQVMHADLSKAWSTFKLQNALNAHLKLGGERVSVFDVKEVDARFDARAVLRFIKLIHAITWIRTAISSRIRKKAVPTVLSGS